MNAVQFVPKAKADARRNVEDFIRFARDKLKVFGAELDFDAPHWPVGVQIWGPRTREQSLSFTKFGGFSRRPAPPLNEPFGAFAKAYIRYGYGLKPTTTMSAKIAAMRALEVALGDNGIWEADSGVFNEAARIIRQRSDSDAAFGSGRQLEAIADFLDENRMVAVRLDWRNPIRLKKDHRHNLSVESAKKRRDKLPSPAALAALPDIFRAAHGTADLIITGVIGLLIAAPERIGEVLALPEKCEVEEGGKYGLRWHPEKGGEPIVKWIIPSMVVIVREAVARLRKLTAPARALARWYEANPTKLYLPPELARLRSQGEITRRQIAEICGSMVPTSPFVRVLGLKAVREANRCKWYRFDEVERALLSWMPEGFPVLDRRTGLKFSNALCVVRMNELIPRRSTHHAVLEPINIVHVNGFLGSGPETRSLFERYGFKEPDGSPIAMTSHQFRHWLNTIAQKGGLSQLDIARWSGRKKVEQNQAYNHITAEEFVATIKGVTVRAEDVKVFGPIGELAPRDPVERAEFLKMQMPAAHTTDVGFCIHDFALTPCQLHRDCANCSEHVIIKGDPRQKANVALRLEEAEQALAHAHRGERDGQVGADRWTAHQAKTVERLKWMQKAHDDPAIPDGSIVQLPTPEMPSQIRISVERRADTNVELKKLLDDVTLG